MGLPDASHSDRSAPAAPSVTPQGTWLWDDERTLADLRSLVVGSMCHCDHEGDCPDHWQFFYAAEMGHDGEHVRRGRTLEKRHLDALLGSVQYVIATGPPLTADELRAIARAIGDAGASSVPTTEVGQ